MRTKASPALFVISVLLILFFGGAVSSQVAQGQGGITVCSQALTDLLAEVRRLRMAVEGEKRDSYRGLMLVERVRLQQEHVDRLAARLHDVRLDLSSTKTHLPQMQERVKAFESQIVDTHDAAQLSQLELELNVLKGTVEQQAERQRMQQESEAELAAQLQAEQSRLRELNDRLQAMEADSEGQATTAAPGS